MSNFWKKAIFILISLLTFHFALLTPVYAQSPAATPIAGSLTPANYPPPPNIAPTSPFYTDLLVNNMFHTFSCLAIGQSIIAQPCLSYQITKDTQGIVHSIPILSQTNLSGGVLGTTGNLIGVLYTNPPIRTSEYLASLGENLGIKEAHAQTVLGSGEGVLNPILKLWQISRNISYIIMVIILLVIGLMVMFRQRINPQTVITAQAALPGLILGVILITFSYFLASLASDTAFIGTNVVGYYFSQVRDPSQPPQNLVDELEYPKPLPNQTASGPANILTIFSKFTGIVGIPEAKSAVATVWDQLSGGTQLFLRIVGTAIVAQFALPIGNLAGGVGQLVSSVVSLIAVNVTPDGIVGVVLSMLATFILVYAMLRLLLRLINAYLTIIFLTITAPFSFLAAALPGRQGIATGWILNMLSNALAFPAVLAVLYFVAFILNDPSNTPAPFRISDSSSILGGSLIPTAQAANPVNIVEVNTFPLFGGMSLQLIRILLAFGALVALPAIPDIIARTIGRVGVAGQLLGEEYGRGTAGGRGYYNQFGGTGPGFAERVGNLRDQPFREAVSQDAKGRPIFKEQWTTLAGRGSPTQGTWSRFMSSDLMRTIRGIKKP